VKVSFTSKGDLAQSERFLKAALKFDPRKALESAAKEGVRALAAATPRDSGLAANSWSYKISGGRNGVTITWINSDVENGFPVALMLQYGYGTGTGGYVQGQDYINPAMQPIFDRIANQVAKAVSAL
jgi:hypothetical protein